MLHRNHVAAGAVALVAALTLTGMTAVAADAPKMKAYSDPRELRVAPMPAPVPALKYRLLPLESERMPGDAAPIYIRLGGQATTEGMREITRKSTEWANLQLDQLPIAEARKFVDQWTGTLHQLEFGARRQTCNWNYTLPEQKEHVIEILLPDAQDMRNWARLLALKARVEIAERKYDEATRTIETGISINRHVGAGPFVINTLVGVAGAQVMLGCVEELIAQPDAPNLYWALTALPRPLVGARAALEIEEVLAEWMLPELIEARRARTEAEWAPLLARLHARMNAVEAKTMVTDSTGVAHPVKVKLTDLAAYKAAALPAAQAYVKDRRGSIEGLPEDQVIFLYLAGRYREFYDNEFKYAYLPFPDALAAAAGAEERRKALEDGPLSVFATLIPNITGVLRAEARLDRTVAAQRVIEALRLHAADRGELPGSLDQVTIVPIPLDPLTGKPFTYRREGETAILIGPDSVPQTVLTYRITLRK